MPPRDLGVEFIRSAPLRLATHKDAPRSHSWRRWAMEQKKPRAIDLFSGCGGLSLGLERAGYSVVLSAEQDAWCLETYRHNLPGTALDVDLSDPGRIDALVQLVGEVPIDLIAGGPPCQPFSRAGQAKLRSLVEEGARPAHDARRELWQSYLEVIERVRPGAVLMENVPDMALGDELMILRVMTARLEAIGYDVEARLADAWRFGVPQHRQRLILVARRDGRPFVWPAQGRCKKVSLREAIGDLPRLGQTTGAQEMKARKPTTPFQRRARKGMNGSSIVWDHLTRPVRADDLEAFQLMKPGTRYSELPARLRRYRSDIFNDKYNRLSWDELCRSITAHIAKDGYWYIHPSEHRTLTVRESARVQTFPDNFRFAGTRGHAFRQIGNAVPPALGEGIGRALLAGNKCKPLAPTRRPAARLEKIRSRLQSWSLGDAKDAPWRHPGDPWAVLTGLVLGDRSGARDEAVRGFLEMFPAPGRGVSTAIRKAAEKLSTPRQKGYLRMANAARVLAGRKKNAWESDAWVAAANLGPAEEGFLRTLAFGEDRVLVSSAILRVVGRVMGQESEVTRRGSDGRMLVGKILGVGSGTSELTAGLQALGRALCTTEEPACRRCPLRGVCEGRQ